MKRYFLFLVGFFAFLLISFLAVNILFTSSHIAAQEENGYCGDEICLDSESGGNETVENCPQDCQWVCYDFQCVRGTLKGDGTGRACSSETDESCWGKCNEMGTCDINQQDGVACASSAACNGGKPCDTNADCGGPTNERFDYSEETGYVNLIQDDICVPVTASNNKNNFLAMATDKLAKVSTGRCAKNFTTLFKKCGPQGECHPATTPWGNHYICCGETPKGEVSSSQQSGKLCTGIQNGLFFCADSKEFLPKAESSGGICALVVCPTGFNTNTRECTYGPTMQFAQSCGTPQEKKIHYCSGEVACDMVFTLPGKCFTDGAGVACDTIQVSIECNGPCDGSTGGGSPGQGEGTSCSTLGETADCACGGTQECALDTETNTYKWTECTPVRSVCATLDNGGRQCQCQLGEGNDECTLDQDCCTPGEKQPCGCSDTKEKVCQQDGTWDNEDCETHYACGSGGTCVCIDGEGASTCELGTSCIPGTCSGDEPDCACNGAPDCVDGQYVCPDTYNACALDQSTGEITCQCFPGAGSDTCTSDADCEEGSCDQTIKPDCPCFEAVCQENNTWGPCPVYSPVCSANGTCECGPSTETPTCNYLGQSCNKNCTGTQPTCECGVPDCLAGVWQCPTCGCNDNGICEMHLQEYCSNCDDCFCCDYTSQRCEPGGPSGRSCYATSQCETDNPPAVCDYDGVCDSGETCAICSDCKCCENERCVAQGSGDKCSSNTDCTVGECTAGATRECGRCGLQTCSSAEEWGICQNDPNRKLVCATAQGSGKTCECATGTGSDDCSKCSCADRCEEDVSGNCKPYASDMGVQTGDYCSLQGYHTAFFNWKNNDSGCEEVLQVVLEVDNNSNFSSPAVVKSFQLTGDKSSTSVPISVKMKETSAPNCTSSCPNGNCGALAGFEGEDVSCGFINYLDSYYWRVALLDESGVWSGWIYYDGALNGIGQGTGLKTTYTFVYTHPAPFVMMDVAQTAGLKYSYDFTDQSVCYNSASKTSCSAYEYYWDFDDGEVLDSPANDEERESVVTHIYGESKKNKTFHPSLTITDDSGASCEATETIQVGSTNVPFWKEVPLFQGQ